MRGTFSNPAVTTAVVRCQLRAAAADPGSVRAETAEHAVTLALSAHRSERDGDRLVADVLRNAEHSVRRSRRRGVAVAEEVARLTRQGIRAGGGSYAARTDPHDAVCARDLLDELREEAVRIGSPAPRVLAGLLVGETAEQTAVAAGVGTATVHRHVRRLRNRATRCGYAV